MTLQVSPYMAFPEDAVTETIGILAVKRAGKSNAAVALAEEMYDCGIPWVAIDPKGDWWGVRSSKDGSGPGLSVVVFGGLHGDVPLEALGGKLVGPQGRILRPLIVSYPEPIDRQSLADLASVSATSSAFANNLGALRTLGLIDYPERGCAVARPVLFLP